MAQDTEKVPESETGWGARSGPQESPAFPGSSWSLCCGRAAGGRLRVGLIFLWEGKRERREAGVLRSDPAGGGAAATYGKGDCEDS